MIYIYKLKIQKKKIKVFFCPKIISQGNVETIQPW